MFAFHRGFGLRPKSATGVPPASAVKRKTKSEKRKYRDSDFFIFALSLCYFRFVPARGHSLAGGQSHGEAEEADKNKRAGRPALLFGLEAEATSTPHPTRRRSRSRRRNQRRRLA